MVLVLVGEDHQFVVRQIQVVDLNVIKLVVHANIVHLGVLVIIVFGVIAHIR